MTTHPHDAMPTTGHGVVARLRTFRATIRWSPWLLLPAFIWLHTSIETTTPLDDRDSYAHVLIGYDILAHRRFTGDPAWNFGPSHDWTTTQWASEVLFAGLHHLFGWAGLTYFTVLCAGAALIGLTLLMRDAIRAPLTTSPLTWIVFALVGSSIAVGTHERPAAISLVCLTVLSRWTWNAMMHNHWPRLWVVGVFTFTWAQFHGYWVLVAAAITLAAILRAIEHRTTSGWRTPVLLALTATIAGTLTPAGLFGLYAPITFKQAASPFLEEWAPTTLTGALSAQLGVALIALVVTAWARSAQPVRLAPLLWVGFWVLYALTAYRNLTPALLMIAPVAASAVASTWPHVGATIRASTLTRAALILTATAAVTVAPIRLATGSPLPHTTPHTIYAALDDSPGPRRVLNFYDYGAQTLALTGSHVRVAVDGRSDKWGTKYLRPHFGFFAAAPGWHNILDRDAPTDIITRTGQPIEQLLPDHGWTVRARDGRAVLWQRR